MADMVYAVHHELGLVKGVAREPDSSDIELFENEWLPAGADPKDSVILFIDMKKYCGDVWVTKGSIRAF